LATPVASDESGFPKAGDDFGDVVSNPVDVNVVSLGQNGRDLRCGSGAIGKFPHFASTPVEGEVGVACGVEDYEVVVNGLFEHADRVRADQFVSFVFVAHPRDCTQARCPASWTAID